MSSSISVCAIPEPTNYSREDSTDESRLRWYYNYTSVAMRFVVDTVSDEAIQRIAKAISNPKDTSIFIAEDFILNVYIIIIVLVALLFCFMLSAFLVIGCATGFHYGGPQMPSNNSICCAMVGFLFCIAMTAFGAFIFTDSLIRVRNSILELPIQLRRTSQDVGDFVLAFGKNLHCNFDLEERLLHAQMRQIIGDMHSLSISIRNQLNTTIISSIFEKEKSLQNNLIELERLMESHEVNKILDQLRNETEAVKAVLTLEFQKIHPELENTRIVVEKLLGEIKDSVAKTDEHQTTIVSELKLYRRLVDEIVGKVHDESKRFRHDLFNVMEKNDYSDKVAQYMPYTLFFPIVLFLLSLTGLIFLFVRCVANCCNPQSNRKYPLRGVPSRVGASVLGFGAYFAMFIGALLFAMVAIVFILAFISMFLCVGLFEDRDLRVLFALPKKEFQGNITSRNISLTLHDTFYKCKNGFTFFDAINGEQIWAQKELETKLKVLRKTSYRRKIRNFHVDVELVDDVTVLHRDLQAHLYKFQSVFKEFQTAEDFQLPDGINKIVIEQKCEATIADLQQLLKSLDELLRLLTTMHSRSRRVKFAKEIHMLMVRLEEEIVVRVANLLKTVNDLSPQCNALMSIWDDFGFYMCNVVATPAQGLWIACFLTAIGSLAIYSALFDATTFLENYSELSEASASESTSSTKAGSKHFKQKSKATLRRTDSKSGPGSTEEMKMRKASESRSREGSAEGKKSAEKLSTVTEGSKEKTNGRGGVRESRN
ncbi:hypothetical protein RB195_012336 [Necator americanus]|uniref:Prominin n=1 Tax=Necator americanus TaxID=51031 RepID=A0ABR1D6L0_NECAM